MGVRVYTRKQFYTKVYGDGGLPKIDDLDKRFVYFDYELDFPYNMNWVDYKVYYITAEDQFGHIIGLAKFQENPILNNEYWINYICVEEEHRNLGFSRLLVNKIFALASSFGDVRVKSSNYTPIGFERLRNLFLELSDVYNVRFIDGELKYYEAV